MADAVETPDPPKRGRGRPRKTPSTPLRLVPDEGDQAPVAVDPAAEATKAASSPPMFGFSRKTPARPAGLTPDAKWFWDYVTEQAKSFQLLKPLDGPALHVMAETYSRWRSAVRMRANTSAHRGLGAANSQGVVTAYWVGIEERAALQLFKFFAEFGLTPATEKHVEDIGIGGNGGPAEGGDSGDEDAANPF